MPKYYGTRDRDGKPIVYHVAPGGDEIHVPAGDKPEDYEHLLPGEFGDVMPIDKHPFWNTLIGRFFGGDSGTALWRLFSVVVALWAVFGFYNDLKSTYGPLPAKVEQIRIAVDSLGKITNAIGDPKEESRYRTQTNISYRIVNKHFPKDVQEARQQMEWGASKDDGR